MKIPQVVGWKSDFDLDGEAWMALLEERREGMRLREQEQEEEEGMLIDERKEGGGEVERS